MANIKYDIAVIGAGIVGMATALELLKRYPRRRIVLLEKESSAALHQTGRNSGVIHAGVYYSPGSLKATLCRQGLIDTIDYCKRHALPFKQCGKLIVATNPQEQEKLQDLYLRCEQNQLTPTRISASQLAKMEPDIRGVEAILVNQTGITDYRKIVLNMLAEFQQHGGLSLFSTAVERLEESQNAIDIVTDRQRIQCHYVVNCSGLMTDRLARASGLQLDFQIIPFKGEYYQLSGKFDQLAKHLIYPVPNPKLPFLGVHLTNMIGGYTTVGPNAVLSLAREGYGKHQVSLQDAAQVLSYPGFWRLLARYPTSTLAELKNSFFRSQYLKQVQKYCPQIQLSDLQTYPSGIRAQAVDKQGRLIEDFRFIQSRRSLHVGNAPSPAATSAMPIARTIADKARDLLD